MQKDEKMVDVTIAAGGKIFKAHKLVRISDTTSGSTSTTFESSPKIRLYRHKELESPSMTGTFSFYKYFDENPD